MTDQNTAAVNKLAQEVAQLKSLVLGLSCLMAYLPDTASVDIAKVRKLVGDLAADSAHPALKDATIAQAMWIAQEVRDRASQG